MRGGSCVAAGAGEEEGGTTTLCSNRSGREEGSYGGPRAATEAGGAATGERAMRARRSKVGRIRMRWDPYNSRNAYIVVKVLNNWNTSILERRE